MRQERANRSTLTETLTQCQQQPRKRQRLSTVHYTLAYQMQSCPNSALCACCAAVLCSPVAHVFITISRRKQPPLPEGGGASLRLLRWRATPDDLLLMSKFVPPRPRTRAGRRRSRGRLNATNKCSRVRRVVATRSQTQQRPRRVLLYCTVLLCIHSVK